MKPTNEHDWKAIPFPFEHEKIILNKVLTNEGYNALILGHRPHGMDDRWFVYCKDSWLYLHRSWTGYCIFKIKLDMIDGNYKLTEAHLSRDQDQYRSSSKESDIEVINLVIDLVIKDNLRS
ncbi:hypothetical protein PQ469_12435 [Mucilaginibacter sp. KACC 22773]|uniref:hypothetical protein n=1 Tax=Mucilaginibacter sp. KACC 22773 TaxID=3025671 RepID=UPI00236523B0|nr:hypothetical protein [Mucilaginibacter sp. KACC 22773]WDF80815.1 hypothetical protein PQ469_12435 [Mucilaginibacter sp. KACC 22773]